ncbi:Uncharacterised protein [Streptococcus pneumoniae]|nr:Uncharacterised protein [Streptococcus pneumoniae]
MELTWFEEVFEEYYMRKILYSTKKLSNSLKVGTREFFS